MQFILSGELKQEPYVDHAICLLNRLLGILLEMSFVKLQYFVISTLFCCYIACEALIDME